MNLFDDRFSWMRPSLWQRFYEAWRHAFRGDYLSGSAIFICELPYRVKRVDSATQLTLWSEQTVTFS
jgi:hypothetical protein